MKINNRLRKALTKILALTNSLDEDCAVDPVEIRDIAKAALAEPVRNCDVIGNTGRALVVHGFPTKSNQWGEGEWLEFVDWLFAPATKKEGEEK